MAWPRTSRGGVKKGNVSDCVNGKQREAGGFELQYANPEKRQKEEAEKEQRRSREKEQ